VGKPITDVIFVGDQSFHLSILQYSNGCFISVTEGTQSSLGSISLSLNTSNVVNTSVIIPSEFSPMFPQLLSELASNLSKGIGLSSVHLKKELKPETAIDLIKEIKSHLPKL
jgi:hypothetical protein|tara:strand:+ start:9313 stop:9648 length:336 start_codon:yes stop_codon:yes gene_type:complete